MASESDEIARTLAPLTGTLYALLDGATHEAKEFFDTERRPFSPSLFPGLVRYVTKVHWDALMFAPHDAEALLGFVRLEIPNDGLAFSNGTHQIRVWKSDEGGLPAPGNSQSKRIFFAQGSMFGEQWTQMAMSDADAAWAASGPINLALLWDVDESRLLSSLQLVCPELGAEGNFGETWRVPVQHPAETTSAADDTPDSSGSNLDLDLHANDEGLPEDQSEGGEDVG
jgi:hypothetical protein